MCHPTPFEEAQAKEVISPLEADVKQKCVSMTSLAADRHEKVEGSESEGQPQ